MSLERKIPALGDYLARHSSGPAVIQHALQMQAELRAQGIYKPFGQIVAESGGIERSILEECLRDQRVDVLAQVNLFSVLPREALVKLASILKNVILPPGETVYRTAEQGDTFYVVASGSVTVSRVENGLSIAVAVRGPGEGFGEIALLTGRSHSTTVVTTERTSLILIPHETFLQTIFSYPAAAQTCATILAERLGQGYAQIVDVAVKGEGYRQFISEELTQDEQPLIGNSPIVLNLLRQIEPLAGNDRPVLVQGEPGTEMRAVAGLIHLTAQEAPNLLLEMDAKSVAATQGSSDGHDPVYVELTQSGTLYGRGPNALPFATDRRPGLLTMARNGMVVINNIERLSRRVQESLADMIEKGWYHAVGEHQPLPATARIVATSSADLKELVAAGNFDRRLYGILSAQTVTVPPLRRRKQDLRMIVDELIRRNSRQLGKRVHGIADEAYQSLMTYDWPGNAEELSLVIRRAVSISRTETLMQDDLFIGPPPVTGKFTLNLLQYGPVQRFLQHRWYPAAALFVSAPFIVLIIVLGLFGPQSPERNAILILTWGLWEPLVVASTFFVSRSWCTVCPIGFMNRSITRKFGLNLKVPQILRNYGFYIAGATIAVIFWTEAASGMLRSPRATAVLVLSILCLGAVFGLVFQRRTWCRYVCGLGGMVGALSTCSALELRSNYGICNSACKDHECYTGTERDEGCPLFLGPFSLTSNLNCVLCGSCIKTCSHQSPVLNLRLPAYDLWAQSVPDRAVAILAIFLVGTQLFRGIGNYGFFGLFTEGTAGMWVGTFFLMGCCVLLAALYARTAGRAVFREAGTRGELRTHRFVYAIIPLCFSFEVGYQLRRFLI
ncbi:MAG: sigma 54-interacting transcriptional regulator, partial [Nitrospirae bacterium]|nr:sigma 54-interacting transcriptional regulator [Nitrospirota bacterium]